MESISSYGLFVIMSSIIPSVSSNEMIVLGKLGKISKTPKKTRYLCSVTSLEVHSRKGDLDTKIVHIKHIFQRIELNIE
jgi:hypothetical protein